MLVCAKNIWLCVALLKKDNFDLVVQKATELGVSNIVPVLCEHSEKRKLNMERMQKIAMEATEQSGRGDVVGYPPSGPTKARRRLVVCRRDIVRKCTPLGSKQLFSCGQIPLLKNLRQSFAWVDNRHISPAPTALCRLHSDFLHSLHVQISFLRMFAKHRQRCSRRRARSLLDNQIKVVLFQKRHAQPNIFAQTNIRRRLFLQKLPLSRRRCEAMKSCTKNLRRSRQKHNCEPTL